VPVPAPQHGAALGGSFGAINAANLRRAQALLESGRAKGKIVLEGFGGQPPAARFRPISRYASANPCDCRFHARA